MASTSNEKYQDYQLVVRTEGIIANEIMQTVMALGLPLKLDELTEAIKSLTASAPEINLDSQFKIRKDLTSKIVRAESLSSYYEELLNDDVPFVRSEFRITSS